MAERLKNTLSFTNLAPNDSVVLTHDLQTAGMRPLAPDIIYVPGPDLDVVSTATTVTVTNQGGSAASGALLVEAWHTIERAFDGEQNVNLPVKPYIVVSVDSGNQPPQPPFAEIEVFIYARLTGSDVTGTGTLANPYRTFQRAIRDVPTNIPAGTIFRVDITGIGLETLPTQYQFPVFLAADGIGAFDFAQPFFHYYSPVNVQADPQLATGVTGIMTIPAAGAVVTTPVASTALIAIQSPGAGWTPGQLKGKFAIGAGLATNHSVIWDNTADTIFITRITAPTFPIRIMECSAHLQAPKIAADLHLGAVNILNTPVSLLGIKVSSDDSDPGSFGGWGLQVAGATTSPSFQLCELPGAGFNTTVWARVRQCFLQELLFAMAPNLFNQTYIFQSFEVVAAGPRVTVWGARGLDSLFRAVVIEATTPLHYRDLFDNFRSGPVGLTQLQNVQILDTIEEFPPGEGAGLEDGIFFTGGQLTLMGVDVSRSAPGNGTAVHVYGPNATADFRSVTGADYDLGAAASDGAHIAMNDAGAVPATTIAGTSGAFQSGGMTIEAAWPAVVYPAAGGNFLDVANADTSQGSRVWRKS